MWTDIAAIEGRTGSDVIVPDLPVFHSKRGNALCWKNIYTKIITSSISILMQKKKINFNHFYKDLFLIFLIH